MRLYFAYASNMDRAHMRRMCPGAELMGPAQILHWRFFVAKGGYGSIARERGAVLHGVLWRIGASDRAALDRYESVETGLYRAESMPVHFGQKIVRALVYVADDATPGRARAKYRRMVLDAARDWSLPEEYIGALDRALTP